jgi:hypothetical protein
MKPQLITQTKEDKVKAKLFGKIMSHFMSDEEWENARKYRRLLALEDKLNPKGYWFINKLKNK